MANALLSTVNAARQRQPMCAECEKSLPNQIVFDKIESIIRLMQDEQNGLPVKTAKSFMSKIPSVFTGTDLIQWMMRNLKLEDQQEAVHLANLIASHGYIFPIEDHTLSIKNDCTFYRFQTPCLWPSNNSDPENTDYAVYLCKRTMQGKTRLELADYEAENLARLQKMFSRKWEFIFMQAESQAKVDKKRDKLERKVLDSQERAFWDVYRPVPGCVNTTELDIKKACRLSKSAKRCSECQKVAAAQQGGSIGSGPNLAPSPEVSFAQDTKPSDSTSSMTPLSSSSKAVQIVEESEPLEQQTSHLRAVSAAVGSSVEQVPITRGSSEDVTRSPESGGSNKAAHNTSAQTGIVGEEQSSASDNQRPKSDQMKPETIKSSTNNSAMANQQTSSAAEDNSNSKTMTTVTGEQPKTTSSASKAQAAAGHHHHQHHQHQHHHHHHHHPHQHGHHHHHHHRQCPHHKHHQAAHQHQHQHQQPQQAQNKHHQQSNREHLLSIPTESILTATVAASGSWATQAGQAAGEQELASRQSNVDGENLNKYISEKDKRAKEVRAGRQQSNISGERSLLTSKKRSVGSVDHQFVRAPSVQGPASRRKSECNRMLSVESSPMSHPDESQADDTGRPASACCSHPAGSSSDRDHHHHHYCHLHHHEQQQAACGQQLKLASGANQRSASNQSNQQQQMLRKSSLNILRNMGVHDKSLPGAPSGSMINPGSLVASGSAVTAAAARKGSVYSVGQHSTLKGTQSVCAAASGSGGVPELQHAPAAGSSGLASDRQNIDDLERELEALKVRLDRRIGGVKMSKVTQSYLSYFTQWAEYDPFIAQPIPSNPWISDSTELWDSERQTKDVHCRRVRRWAFSLKELLSDPAGREQFHRFLEKEFSAENLKFWDAVQELKRVHSRDVARRVEAIWTEYLAQDANCPINIDSKSYETSKKNMAKNKNNRYIFDEAAGHVYQLMKNDSYPRYLRSDMYKDYKEASEKKRTNQVAFDVFKPQITTLKHKFNF